MEGEPFPIPPSNARPISSASLPPLLGQGMNPGDMYPNSFEFGTCPLSEPLEPKGNQGASGKDMVELTGIEPATS